MQGAVSHPYTIHLQGGRRDGGGVKCPIQLLLNVEEEGADTMFHYAVKYFNNIQHVQRYTLRFDWRIWLVMFTFELVQ